MDIQNKKIKSIVSVLDEINDSLMQSDKDIEMLTKEKDYLNNIISLNKFDIENLEEDKANLRKQCKTLQEDEYKCKNELQNIKLQLLEYEKKSKENENVHNQKYTKIINDLKDKVDYSEMILNKYKLELEELKGIHKIDKRQIEDLENERLSTKDYMLNHIKKDSYDILHDKYEKLQEKLKSRDIMIAELFYEVNNYTKDRTTLSYEEYISHIKTRFKQLENEMVTLRKDKAISEQKETKYIESKQNMNVELSLEEMRLRENLGL